MTVFQVVHLQEFALQQVRNIYYYETITGNPSAAEWQDICDEIRADWATFDTGNILVNDWKFYGITYREVSAAGLPSFTVLPTSGDKVGNSSGDYLPTQIAGLVSVKGNTTKPRNGRTYLCGFGDSAVDNGTFISAIVTAAELFVDNQSVLNAAGTNELQRVAVTWNSSGTQVVAYNNIAGAAANMSTVPATQRRRRIGVGI